MVFPKTSCAFGSTHRCSKELRGHSARVLHLAAAAAAEGGGQVSSGKVQTGTLWFSDVFEGAPPRDEKGQGGRASSQQRL
mmetsp:Transcript_8248/g.16837  ORF Transcript_8248/g.16837 Transcript_8248/m.16837 type:complete len:80 (-) Transcript_8248:682-921(-)